jgi:hypothetical protein
MRAERCLERASVDTAVVYVDPQRADMKVRIEVTGWLTVKIVAVTMSESELATFADALKTMNAVPPNIFL